MVYTATWGMDYATKPTFYGNQKQPLISSINYLLTITKRFEISIQKSLGRPSGISAASSPGRRVELIYIYHERAFAKMRGGSLVKILVHMGVFFPAVPPATGTRVVKIWFILLVKLFFGMRA